MPILIEEPFNLASTIDLWRHCASRLVPCSKQLLTFSFGQERKSKSTLSGIARHFPQNLVVMPQHLADRLGFKQVSRIFHKSVQAMGAFINDQRQVEFCSGGGRGKQSHFHSRQLHSSNRSVLQ